MAEKDDLAASLPEPPPPSLQRRAEALRLAMQRFDGADAQDDGAGANQKKTTAPWRSRLNRPQAGVLIATVIVAAIGTPVAWNSFDQWPARSPQTDNRASAPVDAARQERRGAEPESQHRPPTTGVEQAAAAGDQACDGDRCPPVSADAMNVVASAPSPPEATFAEARKVAPAAVPEQALVVTAQRRAEPFQDSPPAAAVAVPEGGVRREVERADESIVVTSAARPAEQARRGDWNACTVNDPARSLARCRRAINASAKNERESLAEGLSLAWKGDDQRAIAAFDRAIGSSPRNGLAYLNRGLIHLRRGDLDPARADLDRAVLLDGGSARAYYNRSLVFRSGGEPNRARRDEEQAIRLDPRYADIIE